MQTLCKFNIRRAKLEYDNNKKMQSYAGSIVMTLLCMTYIILDTMQIMTMALDLTASTEGLRGFPDDEAMKQFSMENPTLNVDLADRRSLLCFGALLWARALLNAAWWLFMLKICVQWEKKPFGLVSANLLLAQFHFLLSLIMIFFCKKIYENGIENLLDILDLVICSHFIGTYIVIFAYIYTRAVQQKEELKLATVVVIPNNYYKCLSNNTLKK